MHQKQTKQTGSVQLVRGGRKILKISRDVQDVPPPGALRARETILNLRRILAAYCRRILEVRRPFEHAKTFQTRAILRRRTRTRLLEVRRAFVRGRSDPRGGGRGDLVQEVVPVVVDEVLPERGGPVELLGVAWEAPFNNS